MRTVQEEIPSFISVDGSIYPTILVKCDRERDRNKPGLLGLVKIDGVVYRCIGVERHLPLSRIMPGEVIGLKVEVGSSGKGYVCV